ncbi:MAG TPA: hypothetical protein VI318_24880 [Baekduia sp.]
MLAAAAALVVAVAAAAIVVGAPASHADPDSTSAAGTAGFVVAPDAAGVAIRTVRVGYRPRTGALYAVVTLNRELPRDVRVRVRFGYQEQGAAGCVGAAAAVVFSAGNGAAAWTGDVASAVAFHEIEEIVPLPTRAMAGALRSSALVGQPIDCAQATLLGSATQPPVDVRMQAAASVPSVAGFGRPALQLNHRYGAPIPLRDGHVAVSVTCVTARSAHCSGDLLIRQQHTHRVLGRASVTVPLGDTASIPVALRLPAGLAHAESIPATATLQPLHGPSTFTALALTR